MVFLSKICAILVEWDDVAMWLIHDPKYLHTTKKESTSPDLITTLISDQGNHIWSGQPYLIRVTITRIVRFDQTKTRHLNSSAINDNKHMLTDRPYACVQEPKRKVEGEGKGEDDVCCVDLAPG